MSSFAAIALLLLSCRPAAIPGFVVAVIVNSVEGQTSRPFAHVPVEAVETMPSRTDGNTSPAVPMEHLYSWIVAATFHRAPTLICGRPPTASLRMTMRFVSKASARLGHASAQRLAAKYFRYSAGAYAVPTCALPRNDVTKCNHGKMTELPSRHVLDGLGLFDKLVHSRDLLSRSRLEPYPETVSGVRLAYCSAVAQHNQQERLTWR